VRPHRVANVRIFSQNPRLSGGFLLLLRGIARVCGRLLHRIPHRRSTGFRTAYSRSTPEVIVRHSEVMSPGDDFRMSQPLANNVFRSAFPYKIGSARCPQIVEDKRPRLETRFFDVAVKLRSEIRFTLSVASNDELGIRFGLFPCFFEIRSQFGK